MKKSAKKLIIALMSLSLQAVAGNCPSMHGQYTIGKNPGANFATIGEAVKAVTCGGVSGPVTFTVDKGIYNERVAIPAIPGTSANNTVTFVSASSDNSDAVINCVSGDATMVLNGTSYVSFENITVNHQFASDGNCVRIEANSSHVNFKRMVFNGIESARTGIVNATVYCTSGAAKTAINIDDCEINNGSIGIAKGGPDANHPDSKTTVTNCLFFNQYEMGLSLSNENAPVVSNNAVTSLSKDATFTAIRLNNVSNDLLVSNNVINAVTGSLGLWMNNCIASANNMGEVSNNSVTVSGKTGTYGISITGSTNNQMFNFNRVKMSGAETADAELAFHQGVDAGNNLSLVNNMCFDLKTGSYMVIDDTYGDEFKQTVSQRSASVSASAKGARKE